MKPRTRELSGLNAQRGKRSNIFRRSAVLLGFLASACSAKPVEKPAEKPKPAKAVPASAKKAPAAKNGRIQFEVVAPGSRPLFKKLLDTMIIVQPPKDNGAAELKISALAFDSKESDATHVRFKVFIVKKADFTVEHFSPGAKSGNWIPVPGCEKITADRVTHPESVSYSYYFTTCDISSVVKAKTATVRVTFLPKPQDELKPSSAVYEFQP